MGAGQYKEKAHSFTKFDPNAVYKRDNTALILAAKNDDENTFKKLIKLGADPIKQNYMGLNALHAAVLGGNLEIVTYLVENNLELLNSKDFNNKSPLDYAEKLNNTLLTDYLTREGATSSDNAQKSIHTASYIAGIASVSSNEKSKRLPLATRAKARENVASFQETRVKTPIAKTRYNND